MNGIADPGFVLDAAGRMLRTNAPGAPPAPLFFMKGSAAKNDFLFRVDVPDKLASEIALLARTEAPLTRASDAPRHLHHYRQLLARLAGETKVEIELHYLLPKAHPHNSSVPLVLSGTTEADALLARFERQGMPEGLNNLGFGATRELWPPWCIAFDGRQPSSIAFASRLGIRRAAVGVATVPEFRGRGLAAAAVAAWTHHPELVRYQLDYSHNRENQSSRRVAERLGLAFEGLSVAIQ